MASDKSIGQAELLTDLAIEELRDAHAARLGDVGTQVLIADALVKLDEARTAIKVIRKNRTMGAMG